MPATTELATITNDELNTAVTFEEAIAHAQSLGLTSADVTVIVNPYTVLNQNKDALLDTPFFVRLVRFPVDKDTKREYSVMYCVTKGNDMFVVTDGSTGIYTQLLAIVAKRENDQHPTPEQNLFIANGLRKSDYIHEESGQPATTYYLA